MRIDLDRQVFTHVVLMIKSLKIKILQNDNIIRIYHSPKDVVVKPKRKRVELYDNGLLMDSYDLIDKNLSWLEDNETDCSEILLTLTVGRQVSPENVNYA